MMIEEIHQTFKDRTVFITGHTGFKGSWLTLWLKRMGAHVVGYALEPPTTPNNFQASQIESCLDHHFFGDIRDAAQVQEALHSCQPDFVLHMAAQTVVKTGFENPRLTFDVNVTGTAAVLDAVASLRKQCTVICVTSDKCYANDAGDGRRCFVETDPMGEPEPYGASKGCAELVVKAYTHSYFHPSQFNQHQVAVATARAGNVIGGGDWTAHALIPDLYRAAVGCEPVELRHPHASRPWQHVLQALSGYLLLATQLRDDPTRFSGGWNFGPTQGSNVSVAEVSDAFFHVWGGGRWCQNAMDFGAHEAQGLTLSIDKAREELGWHPTWENTETIQRCAEWYLRFHQGEDPRSICNEQIEAFEAAANSLVTH